jgi:hypothetical protein
MKDIHKNPFFYYILVPAVAALWPVIIWGILLPGGRAKLKVDKEEYIKAQQLIGELLPLDPERLNFAEEKGKSADFDYATAVQQAAGLCSIPPGNYKLTSGIIITSGGQRPQDSCLQYNFAGRVFSAQRRR